MRLRRAIKRLVGLDRPVFLLGVGAQKAGTTWLYQYLKSCANSNMGQLKEYHVWDGLLQPDRFPEFDLKSSTSSASDVPALQRQFQSKPSAYFTYFRGLTKRQQLTGDITPSYCGLTADDFRTVRRMIRRAGFRPRVVFLMRDPVRRCWSASRMSARNEQMKGGRAWSRDEVLTHFAQQFGSPDYAIRTRYEDTLEALDQAFRRHEVHLGFYESMFETSEIHRLAKFLNVPVKLHERDHIRNASPSIELPASLHQQCHAFYQSTYEYCWRRFPETRALWTNSSGSTETGR